MIYQTVFRRHELKYIISKEQKEKILSVINKHMVLDKYGKMTISNLYFDTDNYRLIRHSIQKPAYKEKLRVRSYQKVTSNDLVFVEVKKKHESMVYKRRVAIEYHKAMKWLCDNVDIGLNTQIGKEINYFKDYYENLKPHVYLAYDREAYSAIKEEDFRVTFDENIVWRQDDLSLEKEPYGHKILDENQVLMEIKTSEAIPLWMTKILSAEKIYKTTFSKYGQAYEEILNEID